MKTLVTKLRDSAQGAHLYKLNDFVLEIESDKADYITLNLTISGISTVRIDGGGYITSNNSNSTANHGTLIDLITGDSSLYFKVTAGKNYIKIGNKQNLVNFGFYDGNGNPWDAVVFSNPNENSKIRIISNTMNNTNVRNIVLRNKYYEIFDLEIFGKFLSNSGIKDIVGEDILKGNISAFCLGIAPKSDTSINLINQNALYGNLFNLIGKAGVWKFDNVGFDIHLGYLFAISNESLALNNIKGSIIGSVFSLPNNVKFISFTGSLNSQLSPTFDIRTNIVAVEDAKFPNADEFLNNLATLSKPTDFNSLPSWYKAIKIIGTRTTASDSAVSTLQSKGYTVTLIN